MPRINPVYGAVLMSTLEVVAEVHLRTPFFTPSRGVDRDRVAGGSHTDLEDGHARRCAHVCPLCVLCKFTSGDTCMTAPDPTGDCREKLE